MTALIGKQQSHYYHYGCDCISKKSIKRKEARDWMHEYQEEQREDGNATS